MCLIILVKPIASSDDKPCLRCRLKAWLKNTFHPNTDSQPLAAFVTNPPYAIAPFTEETLVLVDEMVSDEVSAKGIEGETGSAEVVPK
jgi:hypothetical protein